ncbi:TIP41-like family-domain-containing protein, partial [Ochromonadaceae sp. CCMP2298]
DLLRQRDEPILFFDEFILYKDDLEDCGDVEFDVKLRVMPSCWFLLSRHYLRVDGSLTRCRETRMFHRFTGGKGGGEAGEAGDAGAGVEVQMEVCWRELRAAVDGPDAKVAEESSVFSRVQSQAGQVGVGTRPQGTTSGGTGGAGGVEQRSTDVLLRSDQGKTQSHLLPLVNDASGVHQFHALVWAKD